MKNNLSDKPKKIPRWVSILGQIAVLLFIFFAITAWQNRSMLNNGIDAPDFTLKTLDGKEIVLSKLKGKRVILHFWATWCPVCKTNIPIFKFIAPYYQDDPLFLSIIVDSADSKLIADLVKEKGIQYPVLLGNAALAEQYQVSRYPTTYFVDKAGKIHSKDSGFLTPPGLWWRAWWTK